MIKGIDVILHNFTEIGRDEFNYPIWDDQPITVSNVLVTPVSTADIIDGVNLNGKTAVYTLCIPKGDTNNWTNTIVEFYGEEWRTIGIPKQYIDDLVPLSWNKQINVERYE